ncbi:hypothetical protein BJ138DRAFT_1135910 [Hygrophoropsis aurantiaca]|uniref:Uncharacterized protein n=1 Tax=Hygrophoropsis aurantiaca TaxID=72124 RepID=A0ACB8ABY9_9AGAM|nr:hypothetical protein BJ138DRAFT_1135910 [Hygrophoropsis aurantiaca]
MVAPSNSPAVAVYCAASIGKVKAFQLAALSLGHALASARRPLVYGGANTGIMGVISGAVLDGGGKVTGIIPYAIYAAGGEKDKGDGVVKAASVAEALDERRRGEIVVNSMHERKVEMAKRVGGFVGLPGGFGTFEEILEVITWNQLNIHNKPVVLLNVHSYWEPLRELIRNGIREGLIRPQSERLVVFVDGPADHAQHETFDWGQASLNALNSWQPDQVQPLPFYWTHDVDSSDMSKVPVPVPESPQKVGWLRKVWHVRARSHTPFFRERAHL